MNKLNKIAIIQREYDEARELLNYLGINDFVQNNSNSTNILSEELFQLPVQVGKGGIELKDGGKPWIVSRHAPGKQHATPTHPQGHNGIDLKAPRGTPVYPIASGIVAKISNDPKGGNVVYTLHGNGKVRAYYAHLDSILVQPGQKVSKNTVIGTVGDSGNAKGRGAHLHYEVKIEGNQTDPLSLNGKPIETFAGLNDRKDKLLDILRKSRISNVKKVLSDAQLKYKIHKV